MGGGDSGAMPGSWGLGVPMAEGGSDGKVGAAGAGVGRVSDGVLVFGCALACSISAIARTATRIMRQLQPTLDMLPPDTLPRRLKHNVARSGVPSRNWDPIAHRSKFAGCLHASTPTH